MSRSSLARTGIWGYLCTDCDHAASDHRLSMKTDPADRPWVCRHCGCAQTLDGPPFVGLSRAQWATWADQHPARG